MCRWPWKHGYHELIRPEGRSAEEGDARKLGGRWGSAGLDPEARNTCSSLCLVPLASRVMTTTGTLSFTGFCRVTVWKLIGFPQKVHMLTAQCPPHSHVTPVSVKKKKKKIHHLGNSVTVENCLASMLPCKSCLFSQMLSTDRGPITRRHLPQITHVVGPCLSKS